MNNIISYLNNLDSKVQNFSTTLDIEAIILFNILQFTAGGKELIVNDNISGKGRRIVNRR